MQPEKLLARMIMEAELTSSTTVSVSGEEFLLLQSAFYYGKLYNIPFLPVLFVYIGFFNGVVAQIDFYTANGRTLSLRAKSSDTL